MSCHGLSCEHARELLNAALDAALEDSDRFAIEAHLAECAECRGARESLEALDAAMVRAVRPLRGRAGAVAERTIERLRFRPQAVRRSAPVLWAGYLLTAAAGFLIAVALLGPWRGAAPRGAHGLVEGVSEVEQPVRGPVAVVATEHEPAAVARIVAATAPLEVRQPDQPAWGNLADLAVLGCPSGTSVRTPETGLCELETGDGCVLRMDRATELALRGPNEVFLARGRLWCQAPEAATFTIVAQSGPAAAPSLKGLPPDASATPSVTCSVFCHDPATVLTSAGPDRPLGIMAASGAIDIVTRARTRRLNAGESAHVLPDDVVVASRAEDPLLNESWMHPLLVRKGHGDAELAARVDRLLAALGRADAVAPYERDLRSLGEYAALPLLRFVQSAESRGDPERRHAAAGILADVAPAWSVPELIALLDDADGEVRSRAARGLYRLTGEMQGLSPDQWREPDGSRRAVRERWRAWWGENGYAWPASPGT